MVGYLETKVTMLLAELGQSRYKQSMGDQDLIMTNEILL